MAADEIEDLKQGVVRLKRHIRAFKVLQQQWSSCADKLEELLQTEGITCDDIWAYPIHVRDLLHYFEETDRLTELLQIWADNLIEEVREREEVNNDTQGTA